MFTIFNPKKAKVPEAKKAENAAAEKKAKSIDSIEADDVAPEPVKKAPRVAKAKPEPKAEPKDDGEIF